MVGRLFIFFGFGSAFCKYNGWLCSLFNVEVGIVVVFLFVIVVLGCGSMAPFALVSDFYPVWICGCSKVVLRIRGFRWSPWYRTAMVQHEWLLFLPTRGRRPINQPLACPLG